MKKLICTLAAALAALALSLPALAADFSASGLTVGGSAQQLGKAKDYGSGKVTVSIPGENPIIEGESPLTGEAFSGDYRLVLANIDTHPRALPHWGVSSADVIYELPIQADGSTRSLALFMTEHPDSAGPIRSARVPMASLREMWGGTYCFYGYQGGRDSNNVKDWVVANSKERRFAYPWYLNGMTKNIKWFPRSSDQSHIAPYNVRMDMNAVLADYQADVNIHPFLFTDAPLERGEEVGGVVISYKATSPAYVSAYQYNEATGLYDRFRNGTPYIDANTGETCAFANVIVLRTDISWASGNPSRPVIRLHGEGVCEIFQNGRYIRGTWARKSTATDDLENRMVFLDESGNELPMQRGKTFIQIVDNEQPVVVLSDEEIAGSVEPQEQRLTIGTGVAKTSKPRATRTPRPTRTPAPTATPEPTQEPVQEETQSPVVMPEDATQSGAETVTPEDTTQSGAETVTPEDTTQSGAETVTPENGSTEQSPAAGEASPPENENAQQAPDDGGAAQPETGDAEQSSEENSSTQPDNDTEETAAKTPAEPDGKQEETENESAAEPVSKPEEAQTAASFEADAAAKDTQEESSAEQQAAPEPVQTAEAAPQEKQADSSEAAAQTQTDVSDTLSAE